MTPTTHALLVCVIFLCGLEETVLSQRKLCKENQCVAIFQEPEIFTRVPKRCAALGGELFKAMWTPEYESLLKELNGSYWLGNDLTADKAAVGRQNCTSVSGLPGLNVTVQPCQKTLDGFLCQFTFKKRCSSRQAGGGAQMKYFAFAGFELENLEMIPEGAIAVERKVGAEYPDTKHLCWGNWTLAPWRCEVKKGGCEHDCNSENKCICPAGHTLHPNGISCMKDPCADCEQECHKEGNTHKCRCKDGYSLAKNGKNCVDNDVCRDRCKGDFEECVTTGGSYRCRCKDGYILAEDGKTCVDDVCKKKSVCKGDFEECVTTKGGYECRCKDGYIPAKDGKTCVDDVCKKKNVCKGKFEECVNTEGGYKCRCKDGYVKEDGECLDSSICMKCEHLKCGIINGAYGCLCREGYKVSSKDPTKCEMFCSDRDCLAVCVNGTQCFCPHGYIHDKRGDIDFCTDIDECDGQDPCNPDQECVNTFGGVRCEPMDYGSGSSPQAPSDPPAQPASVQPATLPSYVKTGSILGITLFFALSATLLICVVRHMVKRCGKLELSSFKGPDMDIFYLQQVTTETYKRLSFDKQCKNDSQRF